MSLRRAAGTVRLARREIYKVVSTNGAKARTLTEGLENRLKADIIAGKIRPRARLRVYEVAQSYGVSATPVREALQRLAEQGFVVLDPQVGARVADLTVEEMSDLYSVRAFIEGEALRRSLVRGDLDWLSRVIAEWESFQRLEAAIEANPSLDSESVDRWIHAHRDLHMTILAACGSPILLRVLDSLYDHSIRYQILLRRNPESVRDSLAEHSDIVDAVVKRDANRAVDIVQTQLALAALRLLSSGDIKEGLTG